MIGSDATASACDDCVARSALLARIGARLEIRSRLRGRLFELLAMDDAELLAAVGRSESDEHDEPPRTLGPVPEADAVCHHDARYPRALSDAGAPRLLHVRGGVERLSALASAPAVALCGSASSTDYGIEMARGIARELSERGITIVSGLADGVGAAAQAAAAAAGAGGLAVLCGGLGAGCPSPRRALADRVAIGGCVLAELPAGCNGRIWGRLAAARTIARLASLTVVIEADETPAETSAAQVARSIGRTVSALPGRVTSRASRGAHALLRDGAYLVRDATDVLALLGAPAERSVPTNLDAALRSALEQVGAGFDTPEKLARTGLAGTDALLTLSRLEVLGLLARGDGGRYVPCARSIAV